ncbi:DUF1491 family protein [Aurantiacibacter gangjinensis]|uniref:Uncharacterized protein n=1 Tax=Aurantiacibacter gangjinensis TaxID=502682 RepID=A0A0G9MLH7_9SPHN|nr:DUF1491 family protein [Aurantiacibacter gangjinensis]APE27504.1 hypothetical protein BMF35_a0675 [Aurantiacibacter gangjinensis]KLE31560.1 hypothetical protein AAW01_08350 [Aurantiacibacter gangjinensis]
MDDRIPTHLEVTGLIRAVENAGGFATVIAKGERTAGTIMAVCCASATSARAYERMPQLDGSRKWMLSKEQGAENPREFSEWYQRRSRQDDDLWIVELDIADGERFLGEIVAKT